MTQNLRIVSVQVVDSSNIEIKFTDNLVPNLVTSNVSIIADTPNVPDSIVQEIKITGAIMSVVCQPLSQFAAYFIQFKSTAQHPFISINGTARLSEDGVSNKYLITGPLEPDNPIKNFLTSYFKDNIFDAENEQTVINKYLDSISIALARALYDVRQVKNENYLSFTVGDERHVRGAGPTDRLFEESAYEVIRVGRAESSANASTIFSFESFPTFPVTLQRKINTETLSIDSVDEPGKFNVNTLVFNLSNKPVTKVNRIVFTFLTSNPVYIYDIEQLGYQIKDSKYDQDFGFSYQLLEDNQIKINDSVLTNPDFSLENIFKIDIEYESKDLGRIILDGNVTVYTPLFSIREVLPPIINVFNLKHAPLVDASNNIPILNGITFIDPNNAVPGAKHPAFSVEMPYRLNGLPFMPGQYAIDYSTGTVYVYGADLTNDGTGPTPPLATYRYRFTYKEEQDYTFDPDSFDLVALPKGNLVEDTANISFSYEEVFIPGVDYIAQLHTEILNERVGNSLGALNLLKTKNSPITNVFQIFNETSGEIYTLDRWNDNKVYFRYNNPPTIAEQIGERVSFQDIINELLFVNTTVTNTSSLRIFKIFLRNNSLVSSTEDSFATSFNTSLIFSDNNIFTAEKWFNRTLSENINLDHLQNVGEYMVDYSNGIIYCTVSTTQDLNVGTVTYKNNYVALQHPHIISVDDIYYRISVLNPKNKQFAYISFSEGLIQPESLDYSDELFLNNEPTAPYQLFNGAVGIFLSSSFLAGVTNQVKFVRSIFEYEDLTNSTYPINFGAFSTTSGFNINVGSISNQFYDTVRFDGYDYYVNINENVPYLSPNITYTFSVIRNSDGMPLWDFTGTIIPGNPIKLVLPLTFSPAEGDAVSISYTFTINNLSRLVVDYNKGDFYVDYTYVADEIIVSYEYGDNIIDFRRSTTISEGDNYFVSYKVGALRDALLRNFGTLVNVQGLADVDLEFNRERYRDALMAALTSFIQGPTLAAIKNIGKTISHIEPEVIESVFQNWSLGSSLLSPASITTEGTFQLLPGKFGNGVLINSPDQVINFPVNSNLRLEEGTFEVWTTPQWNGLDNEAGLVFDIQENGLPIDPSRVFIGVGEYHPETTSGIFTLNKLSAATGSPNKNKDGVFIYYDKDISGSFDRWYVEIIDGYTRPTSSNYKFKITSDGVFYDAKSLVLPKPSNLIIFTGTNTINFSLAGGIPLDEGLTFLSDYDHYFLDFGEEPSKNRLSIFKDISGYINFRVADRDKSVFAISADVSAWKVGEQHHIAASWKINNRDNRDEMHLFIDGFEVPNIIKYGQKLKPYLHEKFRTVNPEEIIGLVDRDILSSVDLHTVSGSQSVTSSINFSSYDIFPGDTIFIDEVGFSTAGYTISSISGQTLVLNDPMPLTLNDARFSINRTQFTITSDIDIASNIVVTTIHFAVDGTDIMGAMGTNTVFSSSVDFSAAGIKPGYLLRIDDIALNTTYTILQVSGGTLVIDDNLPVNIVGETFRIYSNTENEIPGMRALRPSYSISKDTNFNNILTISNEVFAGDLIVIRTLGLNSKRVRREYYVWSDNEENILRTKLPPPIALDEAKITKIILPSTGINNLNSTVSLGVLYSNQLTTTQPSNAQNGRTISVTLSGNNVDFSVPPEVTINGVTGIYTVNETIIFNDYGTLDFANPYLSINYITVNVKPLNPSKSAVTIQVKEKYSITHSEFSGLVPVVKYSYSIGSGYGLYRDGYNSVRDDANLFSVSDIDNYLLIHSPPIWAGFYIIKGISEDRKSLIVEPTNTAFPLPVAYFTGGQYQILNVNSYRSGLQNGLFTFEVSKLPTQAYFLSHGFYEFDYSTYARIKLDPVRTPVYLGSDFQGHRQANAIIDQMHIYSVMLTDTRIGESIPTNQRSITKDFNSLKPVKKTTSTLSLVTFDEFPFTNDADFYVIPSSIKKHFQSSIVVNENFGNSLVFLDQPLIIPNDGILNTKKEGTIEFWVNPFFDSTNDPTDRFYFDAYGAVIEEAVSVNNTAVKLSSPASQILNVKLKAGDPRIDYFVGGKIEIDTQRAVQEESVSLSNSTVVVSQPILQISTVKIIGDLTETDYFAEGSIGTDKKTVYLGKLLPTSNLPLLITYQTTNNNNDTFNTQVIRLNRKLPYQKSTVLVTYIPKSLQGDRISIFKDNFGYVNFAITASGIDYLVRGPTRWARNTWHRVKASYKMNSGMGTDELRLFLDGYEYTNVKFGSGLIFGKFPIVMGSSMVGDGYGFVSNIKFKDPINELFVGAQYTGESPVFALMDNFRISTIARPIYAPYGEPIDVNYTSNIDMAFPVTEDLYTTYLLDFDSERVLNDDFAIIKNRETGLFDFSVNVFDSFGIINSNIKSQEALENLIKVLKPANSRAFISYIR
jgi:hypothetical protein